MALHSGGYSTERAWYALKVISIASWGLSTIYLSPRWTTTIHLSMDWRSLPTNTGNGVKPKGFLKLDNFWTLHSMCFSNSVSLVTCNKNPICISLLFAVQLLGLRPSTTTCGLNKWLRHEKKWWHTEANGKRNLKVSWRKNLIHPHSSVEVPLCFNCLQLNLD